MTAVICICTIVLLVGGIAFGWLWENRRWNNGTCRECGQPWGYFDTDSQGGRGYKCAGGHCEWMSYPMDRKVQP